MSVLILNVGGSQVDVPYTSFEETTPHFVGDVSDAFAGNERNSIRAVKRTFAVVTGLLDATDEASVRSAIGNMAQIPCAGDGFNNAGANITCSVLLTARKASVGIAFWQLSLTVKAVTAV